jgi:hypothetical protein
MTRDRPRLLDLTLYSGLCALTVAMRDRRGQLPGLT